MSDTPDRGPANGLTDEGLPASPTASDEEPVIAVMRAGYFVRICPLCGAQQSDGHQTHIHTPEGSCPNSGKEWVVVTIPVVPQVVPLSAEPLGGAPSTKAGSGADGEPSEEAVEAGVKAARVASVGAEHPAQWHDVVHAALRAAYAVDGRAGDGD